MLFRACFDGAAAVSTPSTET